MKKPRKFKEILFKKQTKKAQGMLRRIAIATEKGDEEELARIKKEHQAWRDRFTTGSGPLTPKGGMKK